MTYRIATVPYLAARPLVDALDELAPERVRVISAVPSVLPELLHADEADAALIPVVECWRGAGDGIVPGVGIATGRRVDSVKLFSRVAPTRIRHVAVDRGSRTSVALLRILFADLYDVQPDFKVLEPRVDTLLDDHEAALVIGDRGFAAEGRFRAEGREDVHIVDLGETWRQMTGLPFVFAVWALGRRFVTGAGVAEREELVALLTRSRDLGLSRIDELAARAAAEGCLGPGGVCSADVIRGFFAESMCYALGEREMAGLRRFHTLCVRHAICPPGRGVDFTART
ncbi:menaquinone biosynthesis protein [bacterium]|nr:menaquinone biosynthesis protein [bacterium]MBU1675854.1 menaquinone biosynthesis protein [bacterium]